MKPIHVVTLLLAAWAGLVLSAQAETVDLSVGTIDLPAGVECQKRWGFDSVMGKLISHDGTPTIEFDLGAGFFEEKPKKEDALFLREGTINGIAWFAAVRRDKPQLLLVVFQRDDQGSFYALFSSRRERRHALRLILHYVPNADGISR